MGTVTIPQISTSGIPQTGDLLEASRAGVSLRLLAGDMAGQASSGVSITGGAISAVTITGATVSGGTITNATVSGGTIAGVTLSGVVFNGGTITGAVVSGGTIDGTPIGLSVAASGAFTRVTTPIVQATSTAGLQIRNSAGTTQIFVGSGTGSMDNVVIGSATPLTGTFTTATATSGVFTLATVTSGVFTTGTITTLINTTTATFQGTVNMSPAAGVITINPTSSGSIDNMTIGAGSARPGTFQSLTVTGSLSVNGGTGSVGASFGTANGVGGIAINGTTGISAYSSNTLFLDYSAANTARIQAAGSASGTVGTLSLYVGTSNFSTNYRSLLLNNDGTLSATSITLASGVTVSGNAYFSGSTTAAAVSTKNITEPATISGIGVPATVNYDLATQSILYYTASATANFLVNFRATSGVTLNTFMNVGDVLTANLLVSGGGTAFYASGFQVDGTNVTAKWQGGTAPTSGNTASVDSYTVAIIKTAASGFTLLASQVQFK